MNMMSLREIQARGLPVDLDVGCGCCALPQAGALNLGDLLISGDDADLGPGDDRILDIIYLDLDELYRTCKYRVETLKYSHSVKRNQEILSLLDGGPK